MKKTLNILAIAALAFCANSAFAQAAGTFTLRAGATDIMPQVNSGDLSTPSFMGTTIDVKSATQFTGGLTYMWTDNISIDLPLGLAFKNDVVGAGAIAGVGKIGTVHALPVTLLGQYRFGTATSVLRPYVGAGISYAYFYKPESTAALSGLTGGSPSNPTTMTMKSAGGPAMQLGLSVRATEHWSVDFNVIKAYITTHGDLSTGQTIKASIDPLAASVAIGYTF